MEFVSTKCNANTFCICVIMFKLSFTKINQITNDRLYYKNLIYALGIYCFKYSISQKYDLLSLCKYVFSK